MISAAVALLCVAGAVGDCQNSDAGALDSANYGCAMGYEGMPQYCGSYDDDDFTSSTMCCACPNDGGEECEDSDAGAMDAGSYDCDGGYAGMPQYCGGYDDSDFTSGIMCCACQTTTSSSTTTTTSTSTTNTTNATNEDQCEDSDEGARDSAGYLCAGGYAGIPQYCGAYDDSDFTSSMMCCACAAVPPTCTTEDLDSQAIELFDGANVTVGGCADLWAFCGDAEVGQSVQALCCATCGSVQEQSVQVGEGNTDGCQDSDAGAVDTSGYSCEWGYSGMPQYCGRYDDSDFTSSIVCCDCEGLGSSPAPTPGPTAQGVCQDSDAGALDASGFACEGGYEGMPQYCGGYDDTDFTAHVMCCECQCEDSDAGSLDADSFNCEDGYRGMPHFCGGFDDSDFTSSIMCCACGPSAAATEAGNTSTTTATTTVAVMGTSRTGSVTTSSSTTNEVEYVVSQSISFASSGSEDSVANAVTSMVTSQFGVSASQVQVTVSSSGSEARRLQTTQWQVDYTITVDSDGAAAGSILEAAAASSADASAMIQSLDAALQEEGASLDTASVTVDAPVIITNTVTATTRTTTATTSTITGSSATTGTTSGTTPTITSKTDTATSASGTTAPAILAAVSSLVGSSSDGEASEASSVAAIAGGVVGGLILVLAAGALLIRRRSQGSPGLLDERSEICGNEESENDAVAVDVDKGGAGSAVADAAAADGSAAVAADAVPDLDTGGATDGAAADDSPSPKKPWRERRRERHDSSATGAGAPGSYAAATDKSDGALANDPAAADSRDAETRTKEPWPTTRAAAVVFDDGEAAISV